MKKLCDKCGRVISGYPAICPTCDKPKEEKFEFKFPEVKVPPVIQTAAMIREAIASCALDDCTQCGTIEPLSQPESSRAEKPTEVVTSKSMAQQTRTRETANEVDSGGQQSQDEAHQADTTLTIELGEGEQYKIVIPTTISLEEVPGLITKLQTILRYSRLLK